MKKILPLVFGLTFLVFGTTAFAEWDIDKFLDISLKNHSISDTFDISCLHQNEDGNYMAISKPDGEVYDTVIDLSKVLKIYHFVVTEKADVKGYDESGLSNYFSRHLNDEELQAYRYIMTNEDNEHYNLLISADEYFYTNIGNIAESWENGIDAVLKVINDSEITNIYDAYSINWHTKVIYEGNTQKGIRYSGVYFDTDKGEFVIFYDDVASLRNITKAECFKLYTVQEFLDIVEKNYDEAGDIVRDVEVADKDGESEKVTIIQKPVQSEDKEEQPKEEPEEEEHKEEPENEPVDKPKADEKPETVEEPDKKPEKTGIDVILFGKRLDFPDQKPIIENDRVLVPFRVIFEALEADVFWDSDTRTVTATKDGITITLTIGENEIVKNGETVRIDVPAQIINSRTLVPIRVISESFENTVSWDGENKVVEIR